MGAEILSKAYKKESGRYYKKIKKDNSGVLDIGCGTAQLLCELDREFGGSLKLYGIDFSPKMIAEARKKPAIRSGKIKLKKLAAENINKLDRSFDIICCCHSFPYYREQKKVFKDICNLLNDGGYLIMASATVNNLYDKLILSFVSLTTGKARYPSLKDYKSFASGEIRFVKAYLIKERIYMPSINVIVYKNMRGRR